MASKVSTRADSSVEKYTAAPPAMPSASRWRSWRSPTLTSVSLTSRRVRGSESASQRLEAPLGCSRQPWLSGRCFPRGRQANRVNEQRDGLVVETKQLPAALGCPVEQVCHVAAHSCNADWIAGQTCPDVFAFNDASHACDGDRNPQPGRVQRNRARGASPSRRFGIFGAPQAIRARRFLPLGAGGHPGAMPYRSRNPRGLTLNLN